MEATLPITSIWQPRESVSNEAEKEALEKEIAELEEKMGLDTPQKKSLVAAEAIEYDVLRAAVAAGVEKPWEIYGREYWASWLRLRDCAEEHKKDPLSVELIVEMAEKALGKEGQGVNAIRNFPAYGSRDDESPYKLEQSETEELERNPYVKLIDTSDGQILCYPSHNPGFFPDKFAITAEEKQRIRDEGKYPLSEQARGDFDRSHDTRGLLLGLLRDTVEWFEEGDLPEVFAENKGLQSMAKPALLQKRITSIHPLKDMNGRLGYALQYWALRKRDYPPAILGDGKEGGANELFVDDLRAVDGLDFRIGRAETLNSVAEEELQQMWNVSSRADLIETFGPSVPNEVFESSPSIKRTKALLNWWHEAEKLRDEYVGTIKYGTLTKRSIDLPFKTFRLPYSFAKDIEVLDAQEYFRNIRDYEQRLFLESHWFTPARIAERLQTREDDFYEVPAYRGGVIRRDNIGSDKDLARPFFKLTGLTSSYRTARKGLRANDSLQSVEPDALQQTYRDFNELLRGTIQGTEEEKQKAKEVLSETRKAHINWNKNGGSPFISVTTDIRTGAAYAQGFLGDRSDDSPHYWVSNATGHKMKDVYGIMVEAKLPEFGYLNTGNDDSELMIAGGLLPESITRILVYKHVGFPPNDRVPPEYIDAESKTVEWEQKRERRQKGGYTRPMSDAKENQLARKVIKVEDRLTVRPMQEPMIVVTREVDEQGRTIVRVEHKDRDETNTFTMDEETGEIIQLNS